MGAREIATIETEQQSFAATLISVASFLSDLVSPIWRRHSQAAQHPALWMTPWGEVFGLHPFFASKRGFQKPSFYGRLGAAAWGRTFQ
jgi:hypothetical protein